MYCICGYTFLTELYKYYNVKVDLDFSIDSTWEFLRLILDLSIRVLRPGGKYFTQVRGAGSSIYCDVLLFFIPFNMLICYFLPVG